MSLATITLNNTYLDSINRLNQMLTVINTLTEGNSIFTGTLTLTNPSLFGDGQITLNVANGTIKGNGWNITGVQNTSIIGKILNTQIQNNTIQLISNSSAFFINSSNVNNAIGLGNTVYLTIRENSRNNDYSTTNLSTTLGVANTYNVAVASFVMANLVFDRVNTQTTLNDTQNNSITAAFAKANGAAQLGFVTVAANGTNLVADSNNDTLTLIATSNVTIQSDAAGDNTTFDLGTTGVTKATYGNEATIPVFLVDDRGRLSSVTNTAIRSGNTTQTGFVQTIDSINSTSTSLVPTANNVKFATDAAAAAFSKANGAAQLGFVTIAANGTNLVADSNNDTLTISTSGNVSITTGDDTMTFDLTTTGITAARYGSDVTDIIFPTIIVDSRGRINTIANTRIRAGSTTQNGVVQLIDSVTSTSTSLAPTANNIKFAVDAVTSSYALANTSLQQGKQSIYIPIFEMINGQIADYGSLPIANTNYYDSGSNDNFYYARSFDDGATRYIQFQYSLPGWDGGTISFKPYWIPDALASSGNVHFEMAGVALGDNSLINTSVGTYVNSIDDFLNPRLHIGPESSAITLASSGSITDSALIHFIIRRRTSIDTLNGLAHLVGVRIFYTVNIANQG